MAGTRRTPINRKLRRGITQKAFDLFKLALKMEGDGAARDSPEYGQISVALHRELSLKVWDDNVLDVRIDDEPPSDLDPMRRASFERAVELRSALIQAT
jgi:hypothetical protein